MTRQPWHIRLAAGLVGLLGFGAVMTIVTCQRLAAAAQRWENQHRKGI